MRKMYFLGTCSTCQRIISDIGQDSDLEFQDIKKESITENQIEEMRKRTDSYESLFSRRAMKYRSMGLQDKNLNEEDYKNLIIQEYTFLKRPVTIINDQIFIGNSKKVTEALKEALAD